MLLLWLGIGLGVCSGVSSDVCIGAVLDVSLVVNGIDVIEATAIDETAFHVFPPRHKQMD
jgi:hypothetical protein